MWKEFNSMVFLVICFSYSRKVYGVEISIGMVVGVGGRLGVLYFFVFFFVLSNLEDLVLRVFLYCSKYFGF